MGYGMSESVWHELANDLSVRTGWGMMVKTSTINDDRPHEVPTSAKKPKPNHKIIEAHLDGSATLLCGAGAVHLADRSNSFAGAGTSTTAVNGRDTCFHHVSEAITIATQDNALGHMHCLKRI